MIGLTAAVKRDDLLEFLDSYVSIKKLSNEQEEKVEYNVRNVIDMDIVELKCNTKFGKLNLEICHYLKDREYSDGMTVKFRFKDDVNFDVKSRVRNAIFRKDISNYEDKLDGDTELVSLQINTVEEFKEFFKLNVIEEDLPARRSVRSFIK